MNNNNQFIKCSINIAEDYLYCIYRRYNKKDSLSLSDFKLQVGEISQAKSLQPSIILRLTSNCKSEQRIFQEMFMNRHRSTCVGSRAIKVCNNLKIAIKYARLEASKILIAVYCFLKCIT